MAQSFRAVVAASAASAVLVAAVYIVATLPPRPTVLSQAPANIVFGAMHLHSTQSDGGGTVDRIAEAASRAGLSFIILTDHGDGTRQPLPPQYLHGVLCIDAAEISVDGGHVVALGMNGAAPYPLGGDAAAAIEDIHRLGGLAIIAHPDSPKDDLAWHGTWDAPYDGVEWMNADSEWRSQSVLAMAKVLARTWLRSEAAAQIFTRPSTTLARWDDAQRTRPILGVAGADAHGTPGYETMFRVMAQAVVLDGPLRPDAGTAVDDARRVIRALRERRTFSILRGYGGPASLEFSASSSAGTARMGDVVAAGTSLRFHAAVPEAPGASVRLLRDGKLVASGRGAAIYTSRGEPGVFRVEVMFPGRPAPWIVSNAILVPVPAPTPEATDDAPYRFVSLMDASRWTTAHDEGPSSGTVAAEGASLRFTYDLHGGPRASQYVAMTTEISEPGACSRVRVTLRADRPMRISVQVRTVEGGRLVRRRRSIYVDTETRQLDLPLEMFEPADERVQEGSARPVAVPLKALMLVVDTVNSAPGARGVIWVTELSLGIQK